MLINALAIAAVAGFGGPPQPATTSAILSGVRACVGTTVDPSGANTRLTGWTPVIGGGTTTAKPVAKAPAKAVKGKKPVAKAAPAAATSTGGGRVLFRDNVMLVLRSGASGGCIVDAKHDTGFSRSAFYADLGTELGVPVPTDTKPPVVALANGERMIVAIDSNTRLVKLILLGRTAK